MHWVLSLLSILAVQLVHAMPASEIRERIEAQIRQRHPNPPDDFWDQMGTDAIPVLKQMFNEAKDGYTRSWLVDGMRHFDDPGLTSLLKNQITSTDDEILKKKMLSSLIQSQGDQVYDFVEPYLKDQDPHVRLAVAQGLRDDMASERARKRLETFAQQEKLGWVKDELKEKPAGDLMKVNRSADEKTVAVATPKPSPTPLPEKDWAGEWKGVYVTPQKNTAANLTLTLLSEKAKKDGPKWKLQLKVPKQAKKEWNEKDVEILYSQSANAHWLEVRDRKNDSVFIAQRKVKP